jgi:hypothetical protein
MTPDSSAPLAAGPFVSMAVFCERLDRQPDGTVDVVGVVDGVSLSADADPGGDAFDATAPVVRLLGLVSLRAGAARGRHVISLRAHFPDGELGATLTRPIELTDQAPGATIGFPFELEARDTGTYWFDVAYDDTLLTRIPLVVERS